MAAPPSDPPSELRTEIVKEAIEKERIEKMTRSLRREPGREAPAGPTADGKRREYRARAVLSFHRFLGRWTAP